MISNDKNGIQGTEVSVLQSNQRVAVVLSSVKYNVRSVKYC